MSGLQLQRPERNIEEKNPQLPSNLPLFSSFLPNEETDHTQKDRVNSAHKPESDVVDASISTDQIEERQGINAEEMLVIRQTLRSGQKINTKQSVIVFGDLNSGAEVVSEGDVIVLGTIRGLVHAGASGDRQAVIVGLRLAPMQIRISDLMAQPPEKQNKAPIGPEKALIEHGKIVIENQSYQLAQLLPVLVESATKF